MKIFLGFGEMGDTILQYVSITKSNCNYGRDMLRLGL